MKLSNYIAACLMLVSVLPACRKKKDLFYTGPSVLEFSNPLTGVNSKETGQSIGGASGIGGDEHIPIRGTVDSVIIQLIGAQRNEPITVTYDITPGTAVEGTDFAIIGTRGQATIPANSSATSIKVSLLNTGTSVKTVKFTLTGSGKTDVTPSANLKTFDMTIFPMKAYLTKTIPAGGFFSSRTGLTYTATEAAANPGLVDIAYVYESGTPKLVAPSVLSGALVASRYSARVFAPAATVPANLVQSYATLQLNAVNSAAVAAIPTSGTTATAATLSTVNIVADGIYGFTGASGKKGYIRIKSVAAASVSIDVMTQP
jgi:hypothetical protein